MDNLFELVRQIREKNKLKREIGDKNRQIRDHQKLIELLDNLQEYIKASTDRNSIEEIITSMKIDYENRICRYRIAVAEFSKERLKINTHIASFSKKESTSTHKTN